MDFINDVTVGLNDWTRENVEVDALVFQGYAEGKEILHVLSEGYFPIRQTSKRVDNMDVIGMLVQMLNFSKHD